MPQKRQPRGALQALHQQLTCHMGMPAARSRHRLQHGLQHVHEQELLLLQPCPVSGQLPLLSHASEAATAGSKLRLQLLTCGRASRRRAADIRKGVAPPCAASGPPHGGVLQPPTPTLSRKASSSSLWSTELDLRDLDGPGDLAFYNQLYDRLHLEDNFDDAAGAAEVDGCAGSAGSSDAGDAADVGPPHPPAPRDPSCDEPAADDAADDVAAGEGDSADAAAAAAAAANYSALALTHLPNTPLSSEARDALRACILEAHKHNLLPGDAADDEVGPDGLQAPELRRRAVRRMRVRWLCGVVLEAGSPLRPLLRHAQWRAAADAAVGALRSGDEQAADLHLEYALNQFFLAASLAADGAALSSIWPDVCDAFNHIMADIMDMDPHAFNVLQLAANEAARLHLLDMLLINDKLIPEGMVAGGDEHVRAVAQWAVSELSETAKEGGGGGGGELAAKLVERFELAAGDGSDAGDSVDSDDSDDSDGAAALPHERRAFLASLLACAQGEAGGRQVPAAARTLWARRLIHEGLPELLHFSPTWLHVLDRAMNSQEPRGAQVAFDAACTAAFLALAGAPPRVLAPGVCMQYMQLVDEVEALDPVEAVRLTGGTRSAQACRWLLIHLLRARGGSGSHGHLGWATGRPQSQQELAKLAREALACRFGDAGADAGAAAAAAGGGGGGRPGAGREKGQELDDLLELPEQDPELMAFLAEERRRQAYGAGAGPSAAAAWLGAGRIVLTPDMGPWPVNDALRRLYNLLPTAAGQAGELTAVGGAQMLLAMATVFTASGEPESGFAVFAFQPTAAGKEEAMYPPPPGADCAVTLTRLGTRLAMAEVERVQSSVRTSGTVSISSRKSAVFAAAYKDAERRLVAKREGAIVLEARGTEGLEAALLLAAKLREVLRQHGRDACVWVRRMGMRWDRKDEERLYELQCRMEIERETPPPGHELRLQVACQRSPQLDWSLAFRSYTNYLQLSVTALGGGSGPAGLSDSTSYLVGQVTGMQVRLLAEKLLPRLRRARGGAGLAGGGGGDGDGGDAEGSDVAGCVVVELQVAVCAPGLPGLLDVPAAATAAPKLRVGATRKVRVVR